jgi:thioredoxin reductase (NADPH)
MKSPGLDRVQDIVAVGAGPASLGVLKAARDAGLSAVAIDKGPVCGALLRHPTYMRWFSTADKLELPGFPLLSEEKNPTRREYLKYCRTYAKHFDLPVATYREVTAVDREDGLFRVHAQDLFGRPYVWRARNVVVATGFYDSPRQLNIPGEELPKVSHRYSEAHYYFDQQVLIVGAGSSGAELALELYRNGAHVTVAMRGERFSTKYWIEPDVENRIAEGSIVAYRNVDVVEIRLDDVVLQRRDSGELVTVPNDFVLAMTGYEPDTSLIERAGAHVDPATGKPALNEYLESTVPGLYVAGTLIAGQDANVVFIENSREHGPRIVEHVLARQFSAEEAAR